MVNDSHETTFYIQVKPTWNKWSDMVSNIRVVNLTQKKPEKASGGSVTVKLTLRIPDSVFMPLIPEAVVVISNDMASLNQIEVSVDDPEVD